MLKTGFSEVFLCVLCVFAVLILIPGFVKNFMGRKMTMTKKPLDKFPQRRDIF